MLSPEILKEPFFQVTIPLAGVLVAGISGMISTNNHRLSDMRDAFNKRFDWMDRRIDEVKETLGELKASIGDLEKRVDSLERKVDAIDIRAWTGR